MTILREKLGELLLPEDLEKFENDPKGPLACEVLSALAQTSIHPSLRARLYLSGQLILGDGQPTGQEMLLGALLPVAPGTVIFDPLAALVEGQLHPGPGIMGREGYFFSGLLEHHPQGHYHFRFVPFRETSPTVMLGFRDLALVPEQQRNQWDRTAQSCGLAATVYWQLGAGMGESYGRCGFYPGRWGEIQAFLHEWLPSPA